MASPPPLPPPPSPSDRAPTGGNARPKQWWPWAVATAAVVLVVAISASLPGSMGILTSTSIDESDPGTEIPSASISSPVASPPPVASPSPTEVLLIEGPKIVGMTVARAKAEIRKAVEAAGQDAELTLVFKDRWSLEQDARILAANAINQSGTFAPLAGRHIPPGENCDTPGCAEDPRGAWRRAHADQQGAQGAPGARIRGKGQADHFDAA